MTTSKRGSERIERPAVMAKKPDQIGNIPTRLYLLSGLDTYESQDRILVVRAGKHSHTALLKMKDERYKSSQERQAVVTKYCASKEAIPPYKAIGEHLWDKLRKSDKFSWLPEFIRPSDFTTLLMLGKSLDERSLNGTKLQSMCAVLGYSWDKEDGTALWDDNGVLNVSGHSIGFQVREGDILLIKEDKDDSDQDMLIRHYDGHTIERDKITLSFKVDGGETESRQMDVENIAGIALVALSQEETLGIFKSTSSPPPGFYPQEQIAD